MFKPGMKVRHRKSPLFGIAILICVENGGMEKSWRLSIDDKLGCWYESNLVPILETNEDAVALLKNIDTY